jgi:uncharacterized iron-regulated membrane protein
MVDDRSGNVERQPAPLAGDRAAQWIRWIHEGSHSGPVWQFAVFLTGVFPLVFAVTGVIMWWRGRRARKDIAGRTPARGELQAAESRGPRPARRTADLLSSMQLQIISGMQQRHIETRGWGAEQYCVRRGQWKCSFAKFRAHGLVPGATSCAVPR